MEQDMKPKDINLKLNIKNYKAGKYIHLMALDAVETFERAHPTMVPLLLSSLRQGDPKHSFLKVEQLIQSVKDFSESLEQIRGLIHEHMYSEFEDTPKGKGHQYITPEGGIGISVVDGEETATIGGKEEEPTKKKATKKKPAKKRATKKKTKKEE